MASVVGRNVLNCSPRYSTNVDRISKSEFASHNNNRYTVVSQVNINTSTLLLELLQCRDGLLKLSNNNSNTTDIAAMIDISCKGWLMCVKSSCCLYCFFFKRYILLFLCTSFQFIVLFSFEFFAAASCVYIIVHFVTTLYFWVRIKSWQ